MIQQFASPPPCPKCESATEPRVAESGKGAGCSFWVCANWQDCKGFINADQYNHKAQKRRVSWTDATIQERRGWACRLLNVGGSLRSIPSRQPTLEQCWIARSEVTQVPAEGAKRLAAVMWRVLQRGNRPTD